jgi:succinoglycan biosynthesis transport protein ExoP
LKGNNMNYSKELVTRPAPMAPILLTGLPSEKQLTIKDLWNILSRQKAILFGALALFMGGAILYCALATRLYKAKGEVQVQKETVDALKLEALNGTGESDSDALDANITIQTQAQVLQSDSLALQVIKDLNLEQNPDFRPKWNPTGWVLGLFSPSGPQDPINAPIDDAPSRRTRALKAFQSKLDVKPVSGTRLIEVSYLNSDRKVAADVVNHLVQGLIDYNFQTRSNAMQAASAWVANQISDLRKQSETLQAKVVELQRESGVYTLGQRDLQGREQVYAPVLDRLQQSTAQLNQAESARIMKGALYQVVKDGDPELISGLSGSGMLAVASPGVSGSLSLIQTLRAQEATAQAQLNELSAKFGSAYPKVAEVSANLETIQSAIHAEAARVAGRVKNDYTIARQVENESQRVYLAEKQQANALNDKTVEYEIVQQEAMQRRSLYENLLGRMKQADLTAGLRASKISVVDPARVPSRPAKPNVLLFMAASLAGGLFIGMCVALFRDATDTKIQHLPELEAYFGETALGILPYHKETRGLKEASPSFENLPVLEGISSRPALMNKPDPANSLAAIIEPRAAYTEAVRALRTSLIRGSGGSPPKVILVTSSVPGEGKSMLSANLAILLAQQCKKVLLVDGDLRTPGLHSAFNLKIETGLSSLLSKDSIHANLLSTAVHVNAMPWLDVLPAGPIPQNPAELLASDRMAEVMLVWREEYDFIIVDGAPVLPVTDSVLLSTLADLTLVVARYKKTEQQSLERTCSILQSQGARRIGLVMNAVEISASNYYNYCGYNSTSYYRNTVCTH